MIHSPSTKIKGSEEVNKYMGIKKDDFPSISPIDANVIKRYNGGQYYKAIYNAQLKTANWIITRTSSWTNAKGVEHTNYYVQDIGKTKE